MLENIKIGDRAEITRKDFVGSDTVYVSQVDKVIDNTTLFMLVPISYGKLINLSKSEVYHFTFITEKGMIRYDVKVLGHSKHDGNDLMRVKLLSNGEKVQRREFFRFSCLLPLQFAKINDDNEPDKEVQKGIIKDLGGGGIRFVSNYNAEESTKIKCIIPLNGNYIIVQGKLLHKQHFPKANFKYQYRVQFMDILPEDRELIIKYIFAEQRKAMKLKDRM